MRVGNRGAGPRRAGYSYRGVLRRDQLRPVRLPSIFGVILVLCAVARLAEWWKLDAATAWRAVSNMQRCTKLLPMWRRIA